LTNDEVNNVYEAGLMHDIGKIGIPDSILRKEGALDLHEFEIIKSHTVIGGEILSDVELLCKLVPAIRHHHERYDGSGYPDQLVGEEIPLMARILSIADTFDAMTSQRTYNRRKSFEDAVKEIEKKAGTQFDPRFVDSLKRSFNKLKNIALENISIDVECKSIL
jgi:HD-GYP domain-containing protein (c-di-GMP phosphodiesterase class II)